jgi:hypothetical protein
MAAKNLKKIYVVLAFSALAVIFTVLSVTSLLRKSPTCDETGHHIGAGYVYITKGDLVFSTDTPPLSRYLMALPLLALDLNLPDDRDFWAREDRGEFVQEFVFSENRDKAGSIVFFARLPMVAIGLLGGIFLFLWVKKYYGSGIGLVAAFMYFFSPNMIAHSRLATTDIAATVFMMISLMCFWDFLCAPNIRRGMFSGIFLSLALLSKYTAILLIPLYIVMGLVKYFRSRKEKEPGFSGRGIFGSFLVMFGVAFVVLWAGYFFEIKPLLDGVLRAQGKEDFILGIFGKIFSDPHEDIIEGVRYFLYNFPMPLRSFIIGVSGIVRHGMEGANTFFMGTWRDRGHPFYFILAFFIKTPIPVILGFFMGIYAGLRDRRNRALNLHIIVYIIFLFIVASRSNLQLGLRYVLPAYPFIFVIAALGISELISRERIFKIIASGLLIWMAVLHFFIWPDYLSYFNELVKGPGNGHFYLRDSNIDWGQDLPALKKYMDNNNVNRVELLYFGTADPLFYGIEHSAISEKEKATPESKVYAISVQYIDSVSWSGTKYPSAKAGRSIFIYDFRQ